MRRVAAVGNPAAVASMILIGTPAANRTGATKTFAAS